MKADLILFRGRLLTMKRPPRASALAAVGDRIVAVGGDEEILTLRGPRTRVFDLGGRPVLPGFTDSHVHLGALARRLSEVDLTPARTLTEALRRVAARARRIPPGQWITGGGFDKNRWGDAFPTCQDLDRVAPGHPVALSSRDGHSLWVNSRALQLSGITRRTRSPAGGAIRRDSRGRPTGILQEKATSLVWDFPAVERAPAGPADLRAAMRRLLRHGVTSAHVMEDIDLFAELEQLREANRLDLRITLYPGIGSLDDLVRARLRSGFGDEWLRIGGVKLLVDGALGSQTDWLFRPHENSDAGCGNPVVSGEELRDRVRRASAAGLACAIHAIGDRANAEALNALAEVHHSPTPLPHRIEHAQLLRARDIPRFARLGVVASMQPCHILGDIEPAERYWGRRCRWAYPSGSLLGSGADLAFGSDAPVETANPIAGIYAAVRRQTADGRPAGGWYRREEGIGPVAALRAYTLGPALASGESHLKGKLQPGYLADIVVLSRDITRLRGRGILDTDVDLVFLAGRPRHRRRGVR